MPRHTLLQSIVFITLVFVATGCTVSQKDLQSVTAAEAWDMLEKKQNESRVLGGILASPENEFDPSAGINAQMAACKAALLESAPPHWALSDAVEQVCESFATKLTSAFDEVNAGIPESERGRLFLVVGEMSVGGDATDENDSYQAALRDIQRDLLANDAIRARFELRAPDSSNRDSMVDFVRQNLPEWERDEALMHPRNVWLMTGEAVVTRPGASTRSAHISTRFDVVNYHTSTLLGSEERVIKLVYHPGFRMLITEEEDALIPQGIMPTRR